MRRCLAAFGAGCAGRESVEVVGAARAEAAKAAERAAGDADAEECDEPGRGVEEGVEGEADGQNPDGEPEGEFLVARLNTLHGMLANAMRSTRVSGLVDERAFELGRLAVVRGPVVFGENPEGAGGPAISAFGALVGGVARRMA